LNPVAFWNARCCKQFKFRKRYKFLV
jgi:hypothetical protein